MFSLGLVRRVCCFLFIFFLFLNLSGDFLFLQKPVLAQDPLQQLNQTAEQAGLKEKGKEAPPISKIVGSIIQTGLKLISILLVILIIVGGFMWMTAGGNTEQITKARSMLINAFIGLIIIVLAYAIAHFVITNLQEATDVTNQNIGTE